MKNPKQNMPKLEEHPKLKDEMVCILQENRSTIINMYCATRPQSMIQSITLEFIRPRCGGFIITRKWFKQFMKQYMCWTYHVATTITSKLPLDWFAQGYSMTYKVVYLVKAYSIRPTLVVNSNPTKVHFIPDGHPNNKIKSSIFFNDAHT